MNGILSALAITVLAANGCGGAGQTDSSPQPRVGVTLGPVLGAVTETSAKVWAQVGAEAEIAVEVTELGIPSARTWLSSPKTALPDADLSAIVALEGLEPGRCYSYRVFTNGQAQTSASRFCTFPDHADRLVVGLMADLDKRNGYPAPSIVELAGQEPDLLIILGDWDHRDASSSAEIRQMHRDNRSSAKAAGEAMRTHFLGTIPLVYVWDDHDYGQNNSDRFSPLREAARAAYEDYWPSYPLPDQGGGIWQKFSYADLAEFFVLDLRSQRDVVTYKDPRFVADTDPAGNRKSLRYDPDRSMLDGAAQPEGLGTGQKEWLKESLLTSPFPWKVVISTVTWNATTLKDDAWWDFMAERQELLDFIRNNGITGVVFVSGDIHTGGGIDDGTHAGLAEMTIPSANLNETERGNPTCSLHESEDRAIATTCGEWTQGMFVHGAGYGLIRIGGTTATLETHNLRGESTQLVLAAGSPP